MYENMFLNRYAFIKKLGEGKTSEVYLANDKNGKNKSIAIKILKNENISHRIDDIIRFQREADTVSKLTHPDIIKIYELGEKNDIHYIAMEYFEGKSLSCYIEKNLLTNHELIVDIIIKISEALEYIHNKNIIHRDIKPGNILILLDETAFKLKELKLIDFGFAQLKRLDDININEMAGTLSYISPEQTGILKKQVDERSDLYSLGIIFYQLLAKKLPFTGENIGAIIHQHIAKKPEPLINIDSNIPLILERIIFKLMEKEQDDRYQSAGGLLKDLIKYKKGLTDFIPGLDDKVLKLRYRTKLIGREKEFDILRSGLEGINNKKGSIYLIKGEAGIGKSRLAEEFKDYISSRGKVIIEGKGFIGKNKTPYGVFKESLNGYIKNFIYYTDIEKTAVKEELKEYLKDLGKIIIQLNPQMKEVIGEYPPLVKLEPEREHQRFITYASQFFLKLSQIENGLIIYIDDMQWVDEGSYELLNEIAYEISKYPLLIVGTYRDNEITDTHSLKLFKESSEKKEYPLKEISIDYFDKERTNKFISNLLYDKEENIVEISGYILQKSKGNPFFALEILKQMINEKSIYHENDKWNINYEIMDKMEISTNIVDILLKRISMLKEREINILSYASVIGRKFDIELLFELGKNIGLREEVNKEIVRIVERAKELQLLEEDSHVKGRILFVHDRIKEAFYEKIGEEKRKQLHNIIGNTIEEMNKDKKDDVIFDLAYHFIEAGNEDKAIEYAYPAGMKAKENYANEEAISYLIIVVDLLKEKNNQVVISTKKNIVEIYLIIGRFDEAIELSKEILQYEENKIEKAKIYKQITHAYFKNGNWEESENYAKIGLKILGDKLPIKRLEVIFSILKEFIIYLIHSLFPFIFIRKKMNSKSEKYKLIIWYYYALTWIYVFNNIYKMARSMLHGKNISESKIGMSEEMALTYVAFGGLLMAIASFKKAMLFHEKAIKICETLNYQWVLGESYQLLSGNYLFQGKSKKSIEYALKTINIFNKIGDTRELGFSLNVLVMNYNFLSYYKNALNENVKYENLSKKSNDINGISDTYINYQKIYFEMGDYKKCEEYGIKCNNFSYANNINMNVWESTIYLGFLYYEQDLLDKSIYYLKISKELNENNNFLKYSTVIFYPLLCDIYIKIYKNNIITNESINIKKIKKFCKHSLKVTKNWIIHYGHALRVTGKYYELINKKKEAEKYFLKCINITKNLGRKYEEAKGYYEYGLFLKNINRKEEAKQNWEKAYTIFKEIDSKVYLERVKNNLKIQDNDTNPFIKYLNKIKDEELSSRILKISKDIIDCKDIKKLFDRIMDIILEMTNAQRGFIIIRNKNTRNFEVLACKSTDDNEINFETFSLSIIYDVLNTGEIIITSNAMNDDKFSQYQSLIKYGIKSVLCFPVINNGEIEGACYLDNKLSGFIFLKDNIEMLNHLTSYTILSMENRSYRINNKKIKIDEDNVNLKSKEYGLTKSEKEILLLVIKGYTNKEISNKNFVSLSTVKTHINNIYKKIGIENREQLIHNFIKIEI